MNQLESHLAKQLTGSEGFFWHRARWDAVKSLLPARTPFRLLDVGAGGGFAGLYLARDFPTATYHFVEDLPAIEAHLVARFGADRNLKGRDASGMDVVLLLDVLEHQQDDRGFLEEWLLAMRPGARLIVTVPALPLLWSEWDRMLGHHRRYRKRDLPALSRGLPADLERASYLFPEMVPLGLVRKLAAWLKRRIPGRKPSPRDAEFPDLSPAVNEALYVLNRCTAPLSRFLPFGSSLLFCLRRP